MTRTLFVSGSCTLTLTYDPFPIMFEHPNLVPFESKCPKNPLTIWLVSINREKSRAAKEWIFEASIGMSPQRNQFKSYSLFSDPEEEGERAWGGGQVSDARCIWHMCVLFVHGRFFLVDLCNRISIAKRFFHRKSLQHVGYRFRLQRSFFYQVVAVCSCTCFSHAFNSHILFFSHWVQRLIFLNHVCAERQCFSVVVFCLSNSALWFGSDTFLVQKFHAKIAWLSTFWIIFSGVAWIIEIDLDKTVAEPFFPLSICPLAVIIRKQA